MEATGPPPSPTPGSHSVGANRRRAVLAAVVVVLTVASAFATRLFLSLGALTHQNPLSAFADVLHGKADSAMQAKVDRLERINIALYGYGGPGHDGPFLTDSIMVLSLRPRRDGPPQVAEVSIPRDWYVPIALGARRVVHGRINEAFQDGVDGMTPGSRGPLAGARLANGTLETLLGIHIDRYVGVDFTAFKDGVDAVGGIDIDVPTAFTDHQYPRGECGSDGTGDCQYETIHFQAGRQHMNGAQALIYTRSRHSQDPGEGTDFARSRRQQLVLQALRSQVVSIGGISHLPDLLSALSAHITTDISIGDGRALYDLVKDVDRAAIRRVSLDTTNFLYDCGFPQSCSAAYLFAHDDTYASVRHFLGELFPPSPVLGSSITVTDATGAGGSASARWTALLGSLGLASRDGGSRRPSPTTAVVDLSGGHHAATAAWLGEYFGVGPRASPPGPAVGAPDPGVLVELGADEERAFNRTTATSDQSGGSSDSSSTPTPSARSTPSPHPTTPAPTPAPTPPPAGQPSGPSVLPPFLNFGPPATPPPLPTPPSPPPTPTPTPKQP